MHKEKESAMVANLPFGLCREAQGLRTTQVGGGKFAKDSAKKKNMYRRCRVAVGTLNDTKNRTVQSQSHTRNRHGWSSIGQYGEGGGTVGSKNGRVLHPCTGNAGVGVFEGWKKARSRRGLMMLVEARGGGEIERLLLQGWVRELERRTVGQPSA